MSWNCYWSHPCKPNKLEKINPWQKLNHFAGTWALGNKANLWKNILKVKRRFGKLYDICPPTYILPEDYKQLVSDREAHNYKDMYISKPIQSSQGKGIKVIGKKEAIINKTE